MISQIVQAVLGMCSVAFIVASNRQIFRRPSVGPVLSLTECIYYAAGFASIVIGWYFRFRFATEHSAGSGNPGSGPGGPPRLVVRQSRCKLGQPGLHTRQSGSATTVHCGRRLRHGIRRPWLYFFSSFFTSFTFALAFYLATRERQRGSLPPSDCFRTAPRGPVMGQWRYRSPTCTWLVRWRGAEIGMRRYRSCAPGPDRGADGDLAEAKAAIDLLAPQVNCCPPRRCRRWRRSARCWPSGEPRASPRLQV